MPKFDLGINGTDIGAAEGREAWSGELPPTGNYTGVLKVLSLDVITSNDSDYQGKSKMRVGVELRDTPGRKYDGYIAWGNLNLIDPSIPFVNQFLLALTDGSDEQFAKIKKAFYETRPDVDERKKHILDIGRWHVGSPEGQLPIKISLSNKPFYNERTQQTTDQVRIESYLLDENASRPSGGDSEVIVEDENVVEVEPEDESLFDDVDA